MPTLVGRLAFLKFKSDNFARRTGPLSEKNRIDPGIELVHVVVVKNFLLYSLCYRELME